MGSSADPVPSLANAPYGTRDVAGILGVSPGQVRYLVRTGFLRPLRGVRREFRFTFQDLVLLRTAWGLKEKGVSRGRIRQCLHKLEAQLPANRPLTAVQVWVRGAEIVVRDAGSSWEPFSGQLLLDFEVSELTSVVSSLASGRSSSRQPEPAPPGSPVSADQWYRAGCELEARDDHRAAAAYRSALQIDPSHVDSRLNLGRLLHETGNVAEAESQYRQVLELDPENPTAHYDLGVVLEDAGRLDEAVAAYDRALALAPALKEAHFNLARIFEAEGKSAQALQHFRAYKKLSESP